jgi:hypothetical protein
MIIQVNYPKYVILLLYHSFPPLYKDKYFSSLKQYFFVISFIIFLYKVKKTAIDLLSFLEKVFLSYGGVAKNYIMYWGGFTRIIIAFEQR